MEKHRKAKSDAAQAARQSAYNAIGLPGSTRGFAVEAEESVFVPYFVGVLQRKGAERLIAIHGGNGTRSESLEQALHDKIDVVRSAFEAAAEPGVAQLAIKQDPVETPTCRCGAPMVSRHRKADGAEFWGCSTFPRCRQTLPLH